MAKVAKIYDGTAWVDLATSVPDLSNYQLKSEGGLTFVKKQTIGTAVSSVTVTDAFSATYENYRIIVSGGTCSASDNNLGLQLGATATGYYSAQTGATYAGASSIVGDNNITSWQRVGSVNTNGLHLNVDLTGPNLTRRTFLNGSVIFNGSARFLGGYLDDTTSYTAFNLIPLVGTITGGTIYVYGYNKG